MWVFSLNYFHCLIFFFVVICSLGRCASHVAFELKLSTAYTFYWHQCIFFSFASRSPRPPDYNWCGELLAPFHKLKVHHPHIEATVIVPFWFQDPVQNNSPGFRLFRHLLEAIVPHTFWVGSTPGYRRGQKTAWGVQLTTLPAGAAVTRASCSPVISAVQFPFVQGYSPAHFFRSHRTSKHADDDMLRIQKPLSWHRPTIGAVWSNFSWEGIISTAMLKTAVWTLFRFSGFSFRSPGFPKVMCFSGPPEKASDACFVPLAPTTYSSLFPQLSSADY